MVKVKPSTKQTVKTKRKRDDQKQNRSVKRHNPDEHRDVPTTKTNKYISDLPPSNKHFGVGDHYQSHGSVTREIPGCDSDDLRSLCREVSHVRDQKWSLEKLKNASADITRVQSLISLLMLVGTYFNCNR